MTTLTTRTGDKGETSIGKMRVQKTSPVIRIMGELDLAQSLVGNVHHYKFKQLNNWADKISKDLYTIMGMLHKNNLNYISAEEIKPFVTTLDEILKEIKVPKMTGFIIPNERTYVINNARAECRKLEIEVRIAEQDLDFEPSISVYLNRLSSVLYAFMIHINEVKYDITIRLDYLILIGVIAYFFW